jgi:hypothetical protein
MYEDGTTRGRGNAAEGVEWPDSEGKRRRKVAYAGERRVNALT